MDHFGISAAVKGATEIYFHGARHSGRTTQLLDSLKNGGRVLVGSEQEKRALEHQLRERGLDVQVVWKNPRHRYEPEPKNPRGRTLLDHGYVEQCYRLALAEEEERLKQWHVVHDQDPPKGETADFLAMEHSKWC